MKQNYFWAAVVMNICQLFFFAQGKHHTALLVGLCSAYFYIRSFLEKSND